MIKPPYATIIATMVQHYTTLLLLKYILAKATGVFAPHTHHVVPYGSSIKYPNL